ncbi:pantoate--beta-alanine ligase [Nocardioides sp.]|uniref:pantoate--beta-alanine ligase n=1 Tax=Nocardioides sp. TaxID=35761 RepID=UPI003564F30D
MTTVPLLARTREELSSALSEARSQGRTVAFVPTMGALHEGHASLVRIARERATDGVVVVSVFVNPLQFGEGEDLDRYPRTLPEDLELCAREGVDVVFAPGVEDVYPGGEPEVTVAPGELATVLEGRTRPGHFAGVLTVVAKLFGLVRPDVAVFGQKDYQQLALIRRMALDLNMAVEIVGAETCREDDGLAMSSRNRYLDEEQRREAASLNLTLRAAQEGATYGVDVALDAARAIQRGTNGVDLDYLEITDPDLKPLPDPVPEGTEGRILIAAWLGQTRLIDNLPIVFGTPPEARTPAPPDREADPQNPTTPDRDGDS